MDKKYVCVEEFEVPILDEEASVLNEDGNYYGTIPIKKGSCWNLDGTNTISGADLKLTNERDFIEISNKRLEKYFVEMRENKIMEEARKCVGGKIMNKELKDYTTKELTEELIKRDAISSEHILPHERFEIRIDKGITIRGIGPAILIVNQD